MTDYVEEILVLLLDSDQNIDLIQEQLEEGELSDLHFDAFNGLREMYGLSAINKWM